MAVGWRSQYFRYKGFFLNIVDLYRKRQDLRMFLEIILSLTTVIIFLLFALKPTALTIINLIKEINEKEATVARLDEKIRDLDVARDVYAQNANLIPIIDSSIPVAPKPETLSAQIVGLAARNSVNVLGISVGEVTLVGKPQEKKGKEKTTALPEGSLEMPISISVSGNYQGLTALIRDIENLRRPIKIDVLGVNVSETDFGRVVVAIISGRAAYLGQK